jgi:antitoxin VapB
LNDFGALVLDAGIGRRWNSLRSFHPTILSPPAKERRALRTEVVVYTYRAYTEAPMKTTRVFKSGNSQAVRLPREFRLDAEEVQILRRGDEIVLRPLPKGLAVAFDLLASLPDDFLAGGRADTRPQARDALG